MADKIKLDMDDIRIVCTFSAVCASDVLELFERSFPDDIRPRDAIETAIAFAQGGRRGKSLRDAAFAALEAGGEAGDSAAGQAAHAAMSAAAAAYLHPLAKPTQVKHILGAAAHAARALELDTDGRSEVGQNYIEQAAGRAPPRVRSVLNRYPAAPSGGGRTGELLRSLDLLMR